MIRTDTELINIMKKMADDEFSELVKESNSNESGADFSAGFEERLSDAKINIRQRKGTYYMASINKKISAVCATILAFFIICTSMVQIHATDNSDIYLHYDNYLKHIEARSCTYFRDRRFFSKKIKKADRYKLKNVPESLELVESSYSTSSIWYHWKSRDEKHSLEFRQYDPISFNHALAKSTVFVRSVDINDKITNVQIYRNVKYGGGYMFWIYDGYCFMLSYTDCAEDEMLLHIQNDIVKE